jgi:hypothetical protein
MTHIIVNSLLPGDVVFDIGANQGDKSAWFSERGLRVVCVEPQPEMIKLLNDRFKNVPNVAVMGVGIGRQRGSMQMSISTDEPTLSTFSEHWKQGRFAEVSWDSTAEVQIIPLDDLVQEFGVPRYCKIDVEGFELEVISGLSKRIGVISYEFTNEYMDHALQILQKLIKLGYESFNMSLGESDEFYFPKWQSYFEIASILHSSRSTNGLWGDIYAN